GQGGIQVHVGVDEPRTDQASLGIYFVGLIGQGPQLLIWANEMEREEIHKLLVKLGEIPTRPEDRSRTRVIDANRSRDTLEYLKKLQEVWGRDSNNPLILPDDGTFDPPDANKTRNDEADEEEAPPKPAAPSVNDISSSASQTLPGAFVGTMIETNATDEAPDEKPTEEDPAKGRPPIRIRFDSDGNLVLESDDLEALDRLEQLMADRAPPSRKHVVYYIQHARPSWIKLNLEDYFKEDKKEKSSRDAFYSYVFDLEPPEKDDDSPQLGKRRKLRFISDNDTKSLVVIGADAAQQETIARLIKLWDIESPEDKQSLRYTSVVKVEHSKAESIVEAIKDAFRDLLSSNDKALEKPDANKESKRDDSDGEIGSGGGMSFTFSGRLSLGIDRITNSIIVSAKGEDLLKLVTKLINDLDEAAKPTGTVQSIQLNGTNPSAIEKALRNMMRNGNNPPNPNQPQGQNQPTPNPANPNANFNPNNGQVIQNFQGNENR
ncbi:MAG: hypothetical protein MUF23_07420, partial [Pirellula sp.]|nr:hypothetical protein [Pirellula sp.]